MKFKVGDRVRIVEPSASLHGREGTIVGICRAPHWRWGEETRRDFRARFWHTAYHVRVDGFGDRWQDRTKVGFPHWMLRPALIDPEAVEFIARMKRLGREPAPREEEAFAKVRKLLEQSE